MGGSHPSVPRRHVDAPFNGGKAEWRQRKVVEVGHYIASRSSLMASLGDRQSSSSTTLSKRSLSTHSLSPSLRTDVLDEDERMRWRER